MALPGIPLGGYGAPPKMVLCHGHSRVMRPLGYPFDFELNFVYTLRGNTLELVVTPTERSALCHRDSSYFAVETGTRALHRIQSQRAEYTILRQFDFDGRD